MSVRARVSAVIERDLPSRAALMRAPPPDGDFTPDAAADLQPAAILVPIIEDPQGARILLTRRADHLAAHSGQVAFPGGKVERGESPAEAALRESEEEIGLGRGFVEIAGCLDAYATGTGFCILPVIGFVRPDFTLHINKGEVAEAFDVPFDWLMDRRNHHRKTAIWQGRTRHYYEMPYQGHHIWGATAGMLRNLSKRVQA